MEIKMYTLGYIYNRKNLQKPLCYPNMRCSTGYRYPLAFQAYVVYPPFLVNCKCDRYLKNI